jgi:hypothetical protein
MSTKEQPAAISGAWAVSYQGNYSSGGQSQPIVKVVNQGNNTVKVVVSIEAQVGGVKRFQRFYELETFQNGETKLYFGPVCTPGHYDNLYVGIYDPGWTNPSNNNLGPFDI